MASSDQLNCNVAFRLVLSVCLFGLSGCGTGFPNPMSLVAGSSADLNPNGVADKVVLDWSGGRSDLYPNLLLQPLNYGKFFLPDGDTLAVDPEAFQAAVVEAVVAALENMAGGNVEVRSGRKTDFPGATVVHLAQIAGLGGADRIGEATYDPCNLYLDDAAIIYGDGILKLGTVYSFEDWVQIFANVTAHEIGHALGYGHVPRLPQTAEERPIFVELMLASHTIGEMLQQQRYLSDESNCPAHAAAYKVSAGPFICRVALGGE